MGIDEPRLFQLRRYLEDKLPELGPLGAVEKFPGGQSNPTFLLRAGADRFVLRCKPTAVGLKGAHSLGREFKAYRCLRDTEVPVPRVLHYCSEPSVLGVEFYIMEFIDGVTFWEPDLPGLTCSQRATIYSGMLETLVSLHAVDADAIGMGDYGPRTNYLSRQIDRWTKNYRRCEGFLCAEMETLIDWLSHQVPPPQPRLSIVHGDYRVDNMLFDRKTLQPLALIDWELSTLGDPLADLAYQCMQWRLPANTKAKGLAGVDREGLGIPSEKRYLDQYFTRMDMPAPETWRFYMIFSYFKLAAICFGIQDRAKRGSASSREAEKVGALAPFLAREGASLIGERAL